MRASYLVKGIPGYPLHPPLTDAMIGVSAGATIFGILSGRRGTDGTIGHSRWAGEGAG